MLKFENVGMRYGSGDEVLKDLNFHLEAGSFHFLTGPSGAGKTSLLKLLYLAHKPSRGLINFSGKDIATQSRENLPKIRRRIGIVFQDFRLFEHMTAFENVALPLKIHGARDEQIKDHVQELLAWVGLKDKYNVLPSTLSGGEQQRVAIARALINKPDLLLADEPTGNIDPEMGRKIMHLFVELNKLGTTTVLATHDQNFVKTMGASVLMLERGRVMQLPGNMPRDPIQKMWGRT